MFGKNFLRALRPATQGHGQHPLDRPSQAPVLNGLGHIGRIGMAATHSGAGVAQTLARGTAGLKLGTALVVTGGAASALAWNQGQQDPYQLTGLAEPEWLLELARGESIQEVQTPGQMLRKHPVGRLVSDEDHLFEAMVQSGQIREFRCFYDSDKQVFYSVVQLGKEVCGYPQTVHGGLTAAIVDETLGGLYTSMLATGKLGICLPALTARLEVDYKKKIPAGTVIMCSTSVEKVEGRKVWMTAAVTDGRSMTYATARALFVSPSISRWIQKTFLGWVPGMQK